MSVASPRERTPAPVNVAEYLPAMARLQPDRDAIIVPAGTRRAGKAAWKRTTFAQLEAESNRLAAGLQARGIEQGSRVAILVPPGAELFALVFALFKMGAVPVLVDPGMGARNLGQCLAEADVDAFIGIPKAHLARVVLRWARTARVRIVVGPRLPFFGETLAAVRADSAEYATRNLAADDIAAILFTSGSTGVPKGAVYTHGIFAAQVDMLRQTYGIEPGEVELATFPLFALFGPALGMTIVVPDMDTSRPGTADPIKLIDAIQTFEATNLFGSPALVDRLSRWGEAHDVVLPSLRRVVSAGAPVPAAVLARMRTMLSVDAQIFTPYGATEALPVASISAAEILSETAAQTDRGAGVCVGRVVDGVEVHVIPIRDTAIPTWTDDLSLPVGTIGEIAVGGAQVTQSYFHRDDATALAKIERNGRMLHRMGDLGYFDDRGRLWVCGRKAHRVQGASQTWYTLACEAVFNVHPAVRRTAVVGVPGETGARPVLCVELEPGVDRRRFETISVELAELGAEHEHTAAIEEFLLHPSFPVDVRHNAKIFREQLTSWASRRLQ